MESDGRDKFGDITRFDKLHCIFNGVLLLRVDFGLGSADGFAVFETVALVGGTWSYDFNRFFTTVIMRFNGFCRG